MRRWAESAGFYVAMAVAVFLVDQLLKQMAQIFVPHGGAIQVIPDFFAFTRVVNLGFSFGLSFGDGTTGFLVTFSVFVLLFFVGFRWTLPSDAYIQKTAIALILGGTIGNLIDRVIYGGVIDFIQMTTFGIQLPVFNVSDVAIVIGVSIYCGYYLSGHGHEGEFLDYYGTAGGEIPARSSQVCGIRGLGVDFENPVAMTES